MKGTANKLLALLGSCALAVACGGSGGGGSGNIGPVSQLAIQSGNDQQPMVGVALLPFTVKASDQSGNAISSQAIQWSVASGPVSLSAASSTTNGLGVATMSGLAGATPGAGQVLALVQGVDTVNFSVTVIPVPTAAGVTTPGGQIAYKSDRNGTTNPAVDTIAAGGTVTWSGLGAGTHLVRSTGAPTFTTQTVDAATYQVTFTVVGTYTYDCTKHFSSMTGRVVVR